MRQRPKITVEEQIEHLKSKGVKFELVSSQEAAEYLSILAIAMAMTL
ncbi:hypothetical protein M2140_000882 [Clostridiales Family XIII bacterium PM5-7]